MKIKKFVREHGSKEIEQFLLSNSDSMWIYVAYGKGIIIRHYELCEHTIYMTEYRLSIDNGDKQYMIDMLHKTNSASLQELADKLNSGKYIWDESPEYKTSWEYEWAANIRI